MKNNRKLHGKKIFFVLPASILLVIVLNVGTTFGKYNKEISFYLALDFNPNVFDNDDWSDKPSAEAPGIVEETPTTVYQVQPGDTLASITEKFHTTVEALLACNKIENPDILQAGTILRIPPADYVVPETTTEETTFTEPTAETELSSEVVSESEPSVATEEVLTEPESQPSDSTEEVLKN